MSENILTSYGGIETSLHEQDGKLIIKNTGDAQGLIDANAEYRADDLGKGKDMRMAARIPLNVLHDLYAMWKANDIDPKVGMKKFLNDPDMKAFRTSNERV